MSILFKMSEDKEAIEFGHRLVEALSEAPHLDFQRKISGRNKTRGLLEIGQRYGVKDRMMDFMINGVKLPSMKTAIRLSADLNICVEWLLTGKGPKRPGKSIDDECIGMAQNIFLMPRHNREALKDIIYSIRKEPELSAAEPQKDYANN